MQAPEGGFVLVQICHRNLFSTDDKPEEYLATETEFFFIPDRIPFFKYFLANLNFILYSPPISKSTLSMYLCNFFPKVPIILLLLVICFTRLSAQISCPDKSFSVCKSSEPFELDVISPSGGIYSGPGISSGNIFNPGGLSEGEYTIQYTYGVGTEQSVCSFKIRVQVIACILAAMPPINRDGAAFRVVNYTCASYPDQFTLTGPGMIDGEYFDPSGLSDGAYELFAEFENQIGGNCEHASQWIDVISFGKRAEISSCIPDMTVESTSVPAFELTQRPVFSPASGSLRFEGPGVRYISGKCVFDPSVAGLGEHTVMAFVTAPVTPGEEMEYSNADAYCAFSIAVGTFPVKLTKFTLATELHQVKLQWQTASESHFDRFEVERSMNIQQGFTTIGVVPGGNSNGSYSLSDHKVVSGIPMYYRLKMIDQDGTFSYSKIESVFLNQKEGKSVVLFPNPTSDYLKIVAERKIRNITLFDTSGNVVWSQKLPDLSTAEISLPKLHAGVYFVCMDGEDNFLRYHKILIH